MLKLFTRKTKLAKASVTVFVTLILVPSVFFVGLLDDVARMKFYSNQAVMAADDYGEGILTNYDALLEELYGFFAVTQDEDALSALDTLAEYSKTSFDPTVNQLNGTSSSTLNLIRNTLNGDISTDSLGDFADSTNQAQNIASLEGMMPYKNLNPAFTYSTDGLNSDLRQDDIFETQMGDFMRYRIFQTFFNTNGDEEDDVLADATDEENNKLNNTENNQKYIEKKSELSEELQEFVDAARVYYLLLKDIGEYQEYLRDVNYAQFHSLDPGSGSLAKAYTGVFSEETYTVYNAYYRQNETLYVYQMSQDYDYLMKYNEDAEDYNYNIVKNNLFEYYNAVNNNLTPRTYSTEEWHYMNVLLSSANNAYNLSFGTYNPILEDRDNFQYIEYVSYLQSVVSDFDKVADIGHTSNSYVTLEACNDDSTLISLTNGLRSSSDSTQENHVNAYDYLSKTEILQAVGEVVATRCGKVTQALEACEEALSNADEDIKNTDQESLDKIRDLISNPDLYTEMADNINGIASSKAQKAQTQISNMHQGINSAAGYANRTQYRNGGLTWQDIYDEVHVDDMDLQSGGDYYTDYKTLRGEYEDLYNRLESYFVSTDANAEEVKNKAESDKEEGEKLESEAEKDAEEETTDLAPRNIPDFLTTNSETSAYYEPTSWFSDVAGSFKDMAKNLKFDADSLGNNATHLLLKVYLLQYDTHMFSSRVTNVNNEKDDEGNEIKAESLTGYEMSKNVNYLYQAELEYLIGGDTDSQKNLNSTRNIILAFRFVSNYAATYSIEEINTAITDLSEACNGIPYVGPAVAIAVDIALRTGISAAESYLEWQDLKEGKSVVVFKTKLSQLQVADRLGFLIGNAANTETEEDDAFKLNYEQYLMIMIFFFIPQDSLVRRTQNLVELNVNNVQNYGRSNDELTEDQFNFRLSKAYTAVEATCTVDADFVILNENVANLMLNNDSQKEYFSSTFVNNKFSYSVIRGY